MNWQTPIKSEQIKVENLNIYPGECFTLWMNKHGRSGEREAIQVELRVTPAGRPQIFTTLSEAQVADFKDWTWEPEPHPSEPPR